MGVAGLDLYEGDVDWNAGTVKVRRPVWASTVTFRPETTASREQLASVQEPGWFVTIREFRDLRDLTTVHGADAKIAVSGGVGSMQSLAPGKYVARYIRANTKETKDSVTGELRVSTTLEWYDAVQFEAARSASTVALPVTRSK
jgi:hypothetical protein